MKICVAKLRFRYGIIFGFQCFNISHADMVFSSAICFCHEKNHFRSSPLEAFLGKDVLKKCSKFTGEHPCRSVISVTLLCNFIEITLRHGFSPVSLLHIFRIPFPRTALEGCFCHSGLRKILKD